MNHGGHNMLFHGGKADAVESRNALLLHAFQPEKDKNILGPFAQLIQAGEDFREIFPSY